ncbi:MAG: tRNA-specific adenosine deaminase, partial [Pseudomonadota bacterium]
MDEHFMREALKEAEKAALLGEVPIGAVIEYKGKV